MLESNADSLLRIQQRLNRPAEEHSARFITTSPMNRKVGSNPSLPHVQASDMQMWSEIAPHLVVEANDCRLCTGWVGVQGRLHLRCTDSMPAAGVLKSRISCKARQLSLTMLVSYQPNA
jgi:hypothetical protein